MPSIKLQFVRPDRQVWEGEIHHIILPTLRGELGVWPLHDPLICALGDGVCRIHQEEEGEPIRVIVKGGYAEIAHDEIIILADHARQSNDVDRATIEATRATAAEKLAALADDSNARPYWEEKVAWCDLLLAHGEFDSEKL